MVKYIWVWPVGVALIGGGCGFNWWWVWSWSRITFSESWSLCTCLQTAGFELLDCTAIKLKRPKVTGGKVGILSDTIRARPKAKQSRRYILPQCKQKS